MLTIEARAAGHRLSVDEGALASGSAAFDRVHFTFDEAWAGLSKVALFFSGGGEAYGAAVNSQGYAQIPWEVLASRGKLSFGVYGTTPGQTAPRITSAVVKLAVVQGAWSEDIENSGDPTPTLIEQFRAAAETAIAGARAVADANDAALKRMEALEIQAFPKIAGQGAVITGAGTISAPLPGFALYGKSVQAGTPSLEDPADIATAGSAGSVGIVCAGKNLLPFAYNAPQTVNGVTFTPNPDGTVTVSGTNTGSSNANFNVFRSATSGFLPNGTYTVSGFPTDGTGLTACVLTVRTNDKSGGSANYMSVPASGRTIVCTDSGTITSIYISITPGTAVNAVYRPMLNVGTDAEAYAPPVGVVSAILTPNGLPGIPVTSGGNYTDAGGQQWICDTIDKAAGVYTQRVGRIVLDGTQTYYPTGTLTGGAAFYVDLNALVHAQSYADMIMCDALVPVDNHNNVKFTLDRISGYKDNGSYPNANWLYFSLTGVTNASEAAAYLAEHPITVLYVLAMPVVTALTAAQIAALDGLRSHEGATAIYTTDAVAPEMAAKLCIDIPTYIDSLLN